MKPTTRELHWFHVANSAGTPAFYEFKKRFLRVHGRFLGHARQQIEKECWNCDGTGTHSVSGNSCRSCGGTGVYRNAEHFLEVWQLGENTYHIPLKLGVEFNPYSYPRPVFIQEIEGRIEHEPVSQSAATRCFMRLLVRYEPLTFYWLVVEKVKGGLSSFRARMTWRLMRLRNKLDLFKPIPEDEIPF